MDKLIEYVPCPAHDILLLQWHANMWESGDAKLLLRSNTVTLSTFYDYMRSTKLLFKAAPNYGIWFAAWFTPSFDGAELALWTAPDKRSSRAWVESFEQAMEIGLKEWPVILGLTGQKKILDELLRLGYTAVGVVPRLCGNGEYPLYITYTTKELYEARTVRIRRVANGRR